jgi:hypothetical protein
MTHEVQFKAIERPSCPLKSTMNTFLCKCDPNLFFDMWFRLSIWPNGHRESQKYESEWGIGRTNEAAGLVMFSLIQLITMLQFNTNRLFGPGSTWTSSSKLVPTPLILLGTSPPCKYVPNKISGVGTNFGLLVHVVPGPDKQRALTKLCLWAEFEDKTISPVASFVLGIHFENSYFWDSRCPFGRIDNRKHILGRIRSRLHKICDVWT